MRWPPTCRRGLLGPGVDGLVVNIVVNGHEPGVVDLAGRTLRKLVG